MLTDHASFGPHGKCLRVDTTAKTDLVRSISWMHRSSKGSVWRPA